MASRTALVLAVLSALLTAGCGGSDSVTEPDVLDFSGTWVLAMTINGPGGPVCSITGTMSIAQEGASFNGTITNGLEMCTHDGETWPTVTWTSQPLVQGVATRVGVTFNLRDGGADVTFSGSPNGSGGYDGTASGNAELGPFNTGVVAVTGTWTTTR